MGLGHNMNDEMIPTKKTAKKNPLNIKKSVKKPASAFNLDMLSGKTPISEKIQENAITVIESLPSENNYSAEIVDANCIEPDPNQPRSKQNITDESIEELRERIEILGQLYPILVRVHPDPKSGYKYMITDGERRWRAIQQSEVINEISIITVPENLSEADILIYQLSANNDREGMTVADKAMSYNKIALMFKREGKTQDDAAKRIGISRVNLSKYSKLCNEEYSGIMDLSNSNTCQDIEALYLLTTLKSASADVYAKTLAEIQDDLVKGSVRSYVKSQIQKANDDVALSDKPVKKQKITRLKPDSVKFIEDADHKKYMQLMIKGKTIEVDLSSISEELKKYLS